MTRLYLNPPHMGGDELGFVKEAFETNWLSTVGPHLDAFEDEMSARVGRHCVAVASGTAALQLCLRLAGVGVDDEVLCPSFTFVASCNPIAYLGAKPVFIDSERASWNLDPDLLDTAIQDRITKTGRAPKAVVVVHLYGQTADMDRIDEVCARYDVRVVEDAAEAVGAAYRGRPAGSLSRWAAFSFNGNKIITTTGGGMVVAERIDDADRARFWSTQARDPGLAYEHTEMGYNFRLSNVLAGIGRGQLRVLDQRVQQHQAVAYRYRDAFDDLPGLSLMPQAHYGVHTNWLSVFECNSQLGCTRDDLIEALAAEDIESRPVWKPMHLQPLFAEAPMYGGEVAEDLFARGICLPSGSAMSEADHDRVIQTIKARARA